MNRLVSKLIRWASVVRAGKDDDQFPTQQVEYFGKTADCIMIFPYGMHANVDGNSLAVMLAMNGALDNRVAIPTSMNRRAVLASGEVTFYNPVTGSAVTFKANGDIEAVSANDIKATAAGNIEATAAGKITLDAGATVEVKGSTGAAVKGIVQGDCICAFTGAPHPMISGTVKGSM